MKKLEDEFAGHLELTVSERAYILAALQENYLRGGWFPSCENKREFHRRVSAKIANLPLMKMVTPEGDRLVSVDEHQAIVEFLLSG